MNSDKDSDNLILRSLLAGKFERVLNLVRKSKGLIIDSVLYFVTIAGFSFIARGRYTEAEKTFKLYKKILNSFNKQPNTNLLKKSTNDSIRFVDECKNANDAACIKIPFIIDLWGHQYDSEHWPLEAILNYIYGMKYLNKDIKKARYYLESANNSYKKIYNCDSNMVEPLLEAVRIRDYVDGFYSLKSIKDVRDRALFLLKKLLKDMDFDWHGDDFRKSVERLNDNIEADLIIDDCIGDRFTLHNVLMWLQLFCLGSIAWPLEWREKWVEEESPVFSAIINLENFNLQSWADYVLRIFSFNDSLSDLLRENGSKVERISLVQQKILNLLKPENHVNKRTLSIKLDELKERMEEFGSLLETRIEDNTAKASPGKAEYIINERGKPPYPATLNDVLALKGNSRFSLLMDENDNLYICGKDRSSDFERKFAAGPLLRLFLKGMGSAYREDIEDLLEQVRKRRKDKMGVVLDYKRSLRHLENLLFDLGLKEITKKRYDNKSIFISSEDRVNIVRNFRIVLIRRKEEDLNPRSSQQQGRSTS